ncbi:MAG TPA: acyl--CoA ligase [Vicinamibacterales bacterium]
MVEDDTVAALLARGASEAPAIGAPGRPALTYEQLRKLVDTTIRQLNSLGIGRNSRVALVLPNGPQTAAAFSVFAAGTTTAPLNPAYRSEEFEFYLTDLKPQALVVQEGSVSSARDVARKLGLPVIDLHVEPDGPAGAFTLKPASPLPARHVHAPASKTGTAEAGDLALVLHTSGTTSRPKIVPLTQRNVVSSARHIAATLELVPADVCLNIMPLFHIHGLVGGVLSSLAAGAQVSCAPDSSPVKFFGWLGDVKPTWYTAAPSLHRAILARAARHADLTAHHRLRFIRSGSAALRPELMESLERTFGVPVLQTYGMTEAAHQVACNPLPPRVRKSGSVGPAAGPEIAIMDEEGRLLPSGFAGEVVIRGPNVTAGYEGNPEANKEAFTDGWFRTGDQGRLDSDGYLWLTGRFKELINRGGEKVSPLEIEAVLMNHPDVQQVVSFALPDEVHGEEVAAAVVRREGTSLTDRDLRRYAAVHLADFKVPRKILFVDEIPKGATGKLQRIGLAARLGLVTSSER